MSSHYTVNVHTMSSDISCMCERERVCPLVMCRCVRRRRPLCLSPRRVGGSAAGGGGARVWPLGMCRHRAHIAHRAHRSPGRITRGNAHTERRVDGAPGGRRRTRGPGGRDQSAGARSAPAAAATGQRGRRGPPRAYMSAVRPQHRPAAACCCRARAVWC